MKTTIKLHLSLIAIICFTVTVNSLNGETISGSTGHMADKKQSDFGGDYPTPNSAAEKISLVLEYTVGDAKVKDLTAGEGVKEGINCEDTKVDKGKSKVQLNYEYGSEWSLSLTVGASLKAAAGTWIASAETTVSAEITGTYGQSTTNQLNYEAEIPLGEVDGCSVRVVDWKVSREVKEFDVTAKTHASYRANKDRGEITVILDSGEIQVRVLDEINKTITDNVGGFTGGLDKRVSTFKDTATNSSRALKEADCPSPCACFP